MSADTVVFKKIERADQHLEDLNRAAERFFEEKRGLLYDLRGEPDTKRGEHRFLFRVEMLQELPIIEWGIRVGDAIHCLRSALDQLVYALSSDPDRNTGFPIFRAEKDWSTRSPAMLWRVPETVVAVIQRHQPYHAGDRAQEHPLAVLSTLSNTDKHKSIPVVALVPALMEWRITRRAGIVDLGDLAVSKGAVLEAGAVVAELPFVPAGGPEDAEVQVDAEFRYRIAFGKTGVPSSLTLQPLTPAYNQIADAVVGVIKEVFEAASQSAS